MRLTIAHTLLHAARNWGDRPAVQVMDESPVLYRELYTEAVKIANKLNFDATNGKHIGILLPNTSRWISALYGTALSGKIGVLLNPRLTMGELLYQIQHSNTKLVITGPIHGKDSSVFVRELLRSVPNLRIVWVGGHAPAGTIPFEAWIEHDHDKVFFDPTLLPSENDTAVLIYTSGTTSLPKGVMLSHQSIVRNAYIVGRRFGLTSNDRVFSAGPFFHSGGLTMHVIMSALYGLPVYSVSHFDPDIVLDCIQGYQCTIYNGIETLFLRLLDSPRFNANRVSSVRTGWATGTPAIIRKIAGEVGMRGIIGVYGITEASPNVTISDWEDSEEHRYDTVGKPHPWSVVATWDPERRSLTPPGEVGELVVRGYSVMQGYYNQPKETSEALEDGWLHTGDLGRIRADGYVEFAGRLKDIVRVGGENVSCLEVENVIYQLEGVELASVLPLEDDVYGQVPVAVVKPAQDKMLSKEAILDFLRCHLASYKIPKEVVFMDNIPMTESGKVQKGRLRQLIHAMTGDQKI
ncbi:MAG: acyl--CoA ligase [Alicyclobacillus macrosporangiidus]|uniref:class I adenylate-forming enzyme family protein n=1 Tax=Alicyclobacillus macrosporangiidus TaxID=392015 RepID=UPI0026F0AA86|nr:class I adenylate-forming enzyme family protein [Alicyclobacillus macrosporangiidus]MCL6597483.1 acyl--CoA ligase [Alicyclobacillus macrosporangiidus]